MRPEMLFTINEYDPNKPDHPITSAWDDTQSKVVKENIDINVFQRNIHSKLLCNFLIFQLKCCGLKLRKDGPEKPWEAWLRNTQVNSGDADKKVSILL